MKKEVKYGLGILSLFILLIFVEYNQPKPIDWSHNFSIEKKSPFGSYGLFKLLKGYFKDSEVKVSNKTIFETEREFKQSTYNYILIGDEFYPSTKDIVALKEFLDEGNNVFIAASSFSDEMKDSFQFQTRMPFFYDHTDSIFKSFRDTVVLNFVSPYSDRYQYTMENIHIYALFDSTCCLDYSVLAETEKGFSVMMYKPVGKGKLFLSTIPLAYTNYYFIQDSGRKFIEKSFNFLPSASVVLWDVYYHSRKSESPLRFVLSNKALRYGLYLTLALVIVFVLFEGKRKQRIIPVIEPLPNNSLDFVKTVGNLYLSMGNHKNIADKKMVYFFDYIKNHYFLHSTDSQFKERLASKSGIVEHKVNKLLNYMDELRNRTVISSEELMELNNQIDDFLKNCR
jgi:hypothetical protein